MTNSIPYWDQAIKWSESLMGAPAALLVVLVCIAAGYVLKMIQVFPNRFIPLCVMLIGAAFLMMMTWVAKSEIPVLTRNFCVGFVLGFIAWMLHRLVLKRIEKKFGLFASDDTEFREKPAVKPTEDPKP